MNLVVTRLLLSLAHIAIASATVTWYTSKSLCMEAFRLEPSLKSLYILMTCFLQKERSTSRRHLVPHELGWQALSAIRHGRLFGW